MTVGGTVADYAVTADEPGAPKLPLVSVIIVNYNYGRFLLEAISSVFRQTYQRVECLVVDNGSTDESHAVIDACARRYPDLRVSWRETNGGQTIACCEGFALTRAPYVIFLDADDYLLPHCVASHMAVHLSSRVHVGFTSGDMLQMVEGQIVLSTSEGMGKVLRKPLEPAFDLLRPSASLGVLRDVATDLVDRVHMVARKQTDWVWAPTSGNCFRRDALTLLCDGENLAALKSQTDLYLALAVNALCSSILIDEPLFAYRLHGANVFSNRPQLEGFLNFDVGRTSGQADIARRLIIEQLAKHPDRFVQEPWMRWDYYEIMRRFDSRVTDSGDWYGGSYAARQVARNFDAIAAVAGRSHTFVFVLAGAPWRLKLLLLARLAPVTPGGRVEENA